MPEMTRKCELKLKLTDDQKDNWGILTAVIDGVEYSKKMDESDLPSKLTNSFVYACTIQDFIDNEGSKDKGVACDDEVCILTFDITILNVTSHRRIILDKVETKKTK